MIRGITSLGILLLLGALVAMACSDKNNKPTPPAIFQSPAPAIGGQAPPLAQVRQVQVTVRESSLDPQQLTITAAVPTEIQVNNQSQKACTFFVGEYVSGFAVPPGQTLAKSFTAPDVSASDPSKTVVMGCTGDQSRQGMLTVQFKGVGPGPGR